MGMVLASWFIKPCGWRGKVGNCQVATPAGWLEDEEFQDDQGHRGLCLKTRPQGRQDRVRKRGSEVDGEEEGRGGKEEKEGSSDKALKCKSVNLYSTLRTQCPLIPTQHTQLHVAAVTR